MFLARLESRPMVTANDFKFYEKLDKQYSTQLQQVFSTEMEEGRLYQVDYV